MPPKRIPLKASGAEGVAYEKWSGGKSPSHTLVTGPIGACQCARDMYHLYEGALRCCDSARLRERIIAEADSFLDDELNDNYLSAGAARRCLTTRSELWPVDEEFYWTQWAVRPTFNAPIVCLAYELTGEMRYAAYAKDQVLNVFRGQIDRCRHWADWRFTWICFGSYIPRLMWAVADAMRRDPEGLARAEAEWKRRRREAGMPVYEGPGIDLGSETMDANGNIVSRPPVDLPREAPPRPHMSSQHSLGRVSTEPLPPA